MHLVLAMPDVGSFLKGGMGNFKPSLSNATGWGAGVLTHFFAVRCEVIVLIRPCQKYDQHVARVISTTTTCDLVKSFSNSAVQFLRLSHYQAGSTPKFAAHICAEGNLQHRHLAVDRCDALARPIAFSSCLPTCHCCGRRWRAREQHVGRISSIARHESLPQQLHEDFEVGRPVGAYKRGERLFNGRSHIVRRKHARNY